MGLFHAINEAHENPDVGDIIYDFSQCCDATSCNPVEAQINALIAVVRSRAELNIYDESRVVIGVNTKFEEALMDMRPFMETMFGAILQKNYTTPGERDVISTRQRLFSIEDRGIEIVFIYDPILNHFDYSMGMMMPENAMGIFQLPVEDVMVSDRGLSLI